MSDFPVSYPVKLTMTADELQQYMNVNDVYLASLEEYIEEYVSTQIEGWISDCVYETRSKVSHTVSDNFPEMYADHVLDRSLPEDLLERMRTYVRNHINDKACIDVDVYYVGPDILDGFFSNEIDSMKCKSIDTRDEEYSDNMLAFINR